VCSQINATLWLLVFSSSVVWYFLFFCCFVCFHLLCAEFLMEFSCNFVQLLPQQSEAIQFWILPFILLDQLQDPPLAWLWEVGLLPHPLSLPLCLSQPLLDVSGSSGKLACPPTSQPLFLYLHSFTESLALKVWLLALPPFSRASSAFHCYLTVHFRLQFTVYAFQFCWRVVQSAQGLCWISSWGVSTGVVYGLCYSPVCSVDSHKQLWNWLVERKGVV
jgi:hypothetical protein